jgi:hypothetical protein
MLLVYARPSTELLGYQPHETRSLLRLDSTIGKQCRAKAVTRCISWDGEAPACWAVTDRQPGNAIMLLGHRRRPSDASLRPMRDTPRLAEKVKAAARNRRWNKRMALKPLGGLLALF